MKRPLRIRYFKIELTLTHARQALRSAAQPATAKTHHSYFKGAAKESFLGVPTPIIRQLAKQFATASFVEIGTLMQSSLFDERVLANLILVTKYEKGSEEAQHTIATFYIKNIQHIHDWANVDNSAPYILGRHLLHRDRALLYELISSKRIWDRRIALVTTWWFIRQDDVEETLQLTIKVLKDSEDLIHKAAGWMLREVGKRNNKALERFLNKYAALMPRTMLRYAIEKFPQPKRARYLQMR